MSKEGFQQLVVYTPTQYLMKRMVQWICRKLKQRSVNKATFTVQELGLSVLRTPMPGLPDALNSLVDSACLGLKMIIPDLFICLQG